MGWQRGGVKGSLEVQVVNLQVHVHKYPANMSHVSLTYTF